MKTGSSVWSRATLMSGAALIAVASLTGCGNGKTGPGPDGPKPESGGHDCSGDLCGKPAPEIEGEFITGTGPKTLAESKGTVTIVDFWATFCEPCKKSFPKYQELLEAKSGSVNIIAVSVDDPDDVGADAITKFGADLGVSFPLVWDKDKKTAPKYVPGTMPTSYVIDKAGIIQFIHTGYKPEEAEEISKEVDELNK